MLWHEQRIVYKLGLTSVRNIGTDLAALGRLPRIPRAGPFQFHTRYGWAGLMESDKWVRVNMSVLIWDRSSDSRPRVSSRRRHVGVIDVTSNIEIAARLRPQNPLKSNI